MSESSHHKALLWLHTASKAVTTWIQQEAGIVLESDINTFFASGYQFAVLFAKLGFQVTPSEFSKLRSDAAADHNFKLLKPLLVSLRIRFNEHTLQRIRRKENGAALWLLHQIMAECIRRESKRTGGQTVSDNAFAMLKEDTPSQQNDKQIRLPMVQNFSTRSIDTSSNKSSQSSAEIQRKSFSKRHTARALVRIILHKLRQDSIGDDTHGALPLDAKRLNFMHILMQTLPAVTQSLINVQVGLDAKSSPKHRNGGLSLPPVRGAQKSRGKRLQPLNDRAKMPNPVNKIAHFLMRHNPKHNPEAPNADDEYNLAPLRKHLKPPSPDLTNLSNDQALYEDCLHRLLRQERMLALTALLRSRFPTRVQGIWTRIKNDEGVLSVADIDHASTVILAELWPESPDHDHDHDDGHGASEVTQGARQLQSEWEAEGRKARRRFTADLKAILHSLDINDSRSLDYNEFRVGLMQHLQTQETCARAQYFGGPKTPMHIPPKPSLETFLQNIIDRQIRRKLRNSDLSVEDLFQLFDKDRDGCVSRSELISGLNHVGVVIGQESAKHIILKQLMEHMKRQPRARGDDKIDREAFTHYFKTYLRTGSSLQLNNAMQSVSDKMQQEFLHFMAQATKSLAVADGLLLSINGVLKKCEAEIAKSRAAVKDGVIHIEALNRCRRNLNVIAAKEVELQGHSRAIAAKAVSEAGAWPHHTQQLSSHHRGPRVSVSQSDAKSGVPYMVMQLKVETAADASAKARLYMRSVQRLVSMAQASVKQVHTLNHARKMAQQGNRLHRRKLQQRGSMIWGALSDVLKVSTYKHKVQPDAKWTLFKAKDDPESSDEEHDEGTLDWRGPLALFWGTKASEDEAKARHEAFHVDWKRVRKSKSFKKLMRDWAGGSEAERGQVRDVLRTHYQTLVTLYDYYSKFKVGAAAPPAFATELKTKSENDNLNRGNKSSAYLISPEPEPYSFSLAMFFDMLEKTKIIDKLNCDRGTCGMFFQKCRPEKKVCPAIILQRLPKDCLPRYGFLELFVHLAVAKLSDETDSVREAVERLLSSHLFPALKKKEPLAMRDPREFARASLEGSLAVVAMEAKKRLLLAVFKLFSTLANNAGSADNIEKTDSRENGDSGGPRHMSLALWLKFCEYAGIFNRFGFTVLGAYKCFHEALPAIVDEKNVFRSQPRLSFKGFLEAIVGIAKIMDAAAVREYLRANTSSPKRRKSLRPSTTSNADKRDAEKVRELDVILDFTFAAFSKDPGADDSKCSVSEQSIDGHGPSVHELCREFY